MDFPSTTLLTLVTLLRVSSGSHVQLMRLLEVGESVEVQTTEVDVENPTETHSHIHSAGTLASTSRCVGRRNCTESPLYRKVLVLILSTTKNSRHTPDEIHGVP